MSEGNILFLVCKPCEEANQPDFGVKLAARTRIGYYDPMVPPKELAKWFMKHAKCAGRTSPDHYQLAHMFERDHDQQSLKAVVHDAVVN
jgi:hypothetical protein